MLSIVCPFYNEKENLQELVRRILASALQIQSPWELVLVDDGSTDSGSSTAQALAEGHSKIRLISLTKNHGLTTALYAGLKTAEGDVLATLDADLQNPPEEIPRLFNLLENYDMVTGFRAKRQDSIVKKISSLIANTIRRAVIRDSIKDAGCSLRVFRRLLFEKSFFPYKGLHRFFPCIAQHLGFKILQVPVEHAPRKFGKAKYGLANRILGPLGDLIAIRWLLTHKIEYAAKT